MYVWIMLTLRAAELSKPLEKRQTGPTVSVAVSHNHITLVRISSNSDQQELVIIER